MRLRESKRKGREGRKGDHRAEDEQDELYISDTPYVNSYQNTEITEWSTFLKASQIWDRIQEFCVETDKC